MPGFGVDPYGLGPYGIPGPLRVAGAYAVTTRSVRVFLTREPRNLSATTEGDALNPSTWLISRQDTLDAFTSIAVDRVTAVAFDVTVLELLADRFVTHRVETSTLLDVGGALISPPRSFDFPGVVLARDVARDPAQTRDLTNLPSSSEGTVSGSLLIGAAGDYETESGMQLLRKLITRRLTTPRGGFFHLPAYGTGIPLKQPVMLTGLVEIKAEIERQVLREPEIESVEAEVEFDNTTGVLHIVLRGTLARSGLGFETPISFPVEL